MPILFYLRCLTPPPNHRDREYSPFILVLSRTINVPSWMATKKFEFMHTNLKYTPLYIFLVCSLPVSCRGCSGTTTDLRGSQLKIPLVDDWEGVALQQQGAWGEPVDRKKLLTFSLSLFLSPSYLTVPWPWWQWGYSFRWYRMCLQRNKLIFTT